MNKQLPLSNACCDTQAKGIVLNKPELDQQRITVDTIVVTSTQILAYKIFKHFYLLFLEVEFMFITIECRVFE